MPYSNRYLHIVGLILVLGIFNTTNGAPKVTIEKFNIARIKYGGGGDWYSNSSSLPNLLEFIRTQTKIQTGLDEIVIEISNPRLMSFPYLYLNGHGNIHFTDNEINILREYFAAGGFLHADDNYGMDKSFRREMKRVFPSADFQELPFEHDIYKSHFIMQKGTPKIHEHDKKPAQGLGLFNEGKMVVFYTYQADLGDGWEDPDVHEDPAEKRLAALRMGTNIVVWRLRGGL
ncbi:DUF4159 domain-containing protein [bacterium]|nr:DUF4159 domain-containing protein [bacterium]